MIAKERPPRRKPHSNTTTCQHCRPKPSPSSTAAPVHHDPVHSDVRHQGVEEKTQVGTPVQGGGRVHAQEGYVPRLPPEPTDPHQAGQGQHQPALAAESPNPERMAPQLATGDVIDILNVSEINEPPQELRVGSNVTVVNILNSRTFFTKKLNPQRKEGMYKEHSQY